MRKKVTSKQKSTGIIQTWDCAAAAANELCISKSGISMCLNGKIKSYKGYEWYYEETDDEELIPLEMPEVIEDLTAYLTYAPNGRIDNTIMNIVNLFEHHPYFAGKFSYNEWTHEQCFDGKIIDDIVVSKLRMKIQELTGIKDKSQIDDAINNVTAERHSFHPVKEMIESFEWDGKKRVDDFFIKFLGAPDTPLTRLITHNWFFGLMKRLYEPGCPWDYMLIIHDATGGTGKTKLCERICKGYYTCNPPTTFDKDCIDMLNNCWVVNFDELKQFDMQEMKAIKSWITKQNDTVRLAYARRSRVYDRHVIYYGTTNEQLFLRDYTSQFERRFWILECSGKSKSVSWWKKNLPEKELNQVLAEAYAMYVDDPDYCYDISENSPEGEELRKIQLRHKSMKGDAETKLNCDTILNARYELDDRGEFKSYPSFRKQANAILKDYYMEDSLSKKYVNVIPCEYIKSIFSSKGLDYLTMMIEQLGWEKTTELYSGKEQECFRRLINGQKEIKFE